jgi:hypothetical protein
LDRHGRRSFVSLGSLPRTLQHVTAGHSANCLPKRFSLGSRIPPFATKPRFGDYLAKTDQYLTETNRLFEFAEEDIRAVMTGDISMFHTLSLIRLLSGIRALPVEV